MTEAGVQACLDRLLAVVVLYRADLAATETYRSLAASCIAAGGSMDLFVYDNSPDPLLLDASRSSGPLRIIYRHDPANAGVSSAFNAGARLARELGKEWLLLLDQDTGFPPGAMAVYLAAITGGGELFAPQLVADNRLLSPCGYRGGVGFHLAGVTPGEFSLAGRSVLNSGLLVRRAAFEACGGYDERVQVDFADFAFVNRVRRKYPCITVLDLVCRHGFSNLESVPLESARRRFAGYCRDGRAAAVTPLLLFSHAFLVLRRCAVLTLRYRSLCFFTKLLAYFSKERGGVVP
jgi:GT2 family glycosyltransferase